MKNLENKVIWITGASAGIGEAVAINIAKKNTKLILSARRADELERVKKLTGLDPENVLVLPFDVEKPEFFPQHVQTILDKFGTIDVLFNNAGISQRGNVNATTMEVYRKLMEINFFGVMALTKAVLPIMIQQKSGHIVVTSSVSGKLGTPFRSGYSASKHALHGFFDSLRAELVDHNINVTLICPGYINTNISLSALNADGSKYSKKDTNQIRGLDVSICANQIIKAIEKNKNEVYMGGKEIFGVYLKRFFPRILDVIVRKQIPK